MCLIIISEEKFPSQELFEAANEANDDGIGIAWREGNEVLWDKGIDLDELKYYQFWTKPPWVFHFRVRTHGPIGSALCHPFSIDKRASTDQFGKAEAVLFHNGVYTEALKMMDSFKQQKPKGVWSDTRAMAWLASLPRSKEAVFEFFENSRQKLVYFSGSELKVFGGGWSQYEGHTVSNRLFLWRTGEWDDQCYEYRGYGIGPKSNIGSGSTMYYPGKKESNIPDIITSHHKTKLEKYHDTWCRDGVCFCGKDDPPPTEDLGLEEEWDIFTHEAPEDHYNRVVECLREMGIEDQDICEEKLTSQQKNSIRNLIYEDEDLEDEIDENINQNQYLIDYMTEGCI